MYDVRTHSQRCRDCIDYNNIILLLSYIRTTRISPDVCKYILFCSSASFCQYIWGNPVWFCQAYPFHYDFFIYLHYARESTFFYSLLFYFLLLCCEPLLCRWDLLFLQTISLYKYRREIVWGNQMVKILSKHPTVIND